MDRRDFLKQISLWSAGLLTQTPVFNITQKAYGNKNKNPLLVTGTDKNYYNLVVKTLKPFGGIESFVKKGNKVVIKPNIGWDRRPEQAADTHPEIVKTLVKLALKAGASEVLVFDNTCNEERRCYHNSGIKEAVESIDDNRAKIPYIDKRKFIPADIKKGKSLKRWLFYKDALEADCYINVPIAKHHSLSGYTVSLKNTMGILGGKRGKLHHNIAQNLADINTVINPNLIVVDATRILLRNGPVGGNVNDVKQLDRLIATTDPVAADAYATTLFGEKPDALESTVAAYKMGLGQMNLSKINIKKV